MTSSIESANKMLVNTDYPLDKVIYSKADSVSLPAGFNTTSFAHGLPFIPLVFGNWSTDSDFSTAYNFNSGVLPASPGFLFDVELDISADDTNIYLTLINGTGSTTTAYYRIYAFEPSDSENEVDFTSSPLDNFVINTDYNYTKLHTAGFTAVPSATPITITHDIGYLPQVMAWYRDQYTNRVVPKFYGSYFGNGDIEVLEIEATESSIIITRDSIDDTVDRVDYRIYVDAI